MRAVVPHIPSVSVVRELVEAIEADPRDEGPQLVIADYLLSVDDPRGELIMLDRQERAGELDDPDALDRLLLLAAQYSFPRAEPDDPVLPFDVRSGHYRIEHAGERYDIYRSSDNREAYIHIRSIDADDVDPMDYQAYALPITGDEWSEDRLRVILQIVSDAIVEQTPFDELMFPFGPLAFPQYEGSPLRCYMLPIEFMRIHDLLRNQHGLAARDYYRWHEIWNRLRGMTRR
jgi:uncharacterized protein (TIGR02996 family)